MAARHAQSATLGGSANDGDGLLRHIDQLVERWNHWSQRSRRSDRDNYVDGYIKLLVEHEGRGWNGQTEVHGPQGGNGDAPSDVSSILCEVAAAHVNVGGKVGQMPPDHVARQLGVVAYWGQDLVLVDQIDLVEQVEEFVPSRLTVGLQPDQRFEEALGGPMGQSVLYGFLKPCRRFRERELDRTLLPLAGSEGAHNFPVSMIESAPEIVDSIGADGDALVYDGFVLFSKRGAFAGLCVCFDSVGKRTLFAENFVKLRDVFRGPLDFNCSAVAHEKIPEQR